MKAFFLGVIVTILCAIVGVYVYASGGYAPVAVSAKALPFEQKLASTALKARVEREMPRTSPIDASEANLLSGAKEYVEHCAMCHGVPGQPQGPEANMFPKPPELFKGKGVTDDPPGESYWKIKNGIRLSGMPAFGNHLTDTQAWQIAQLVANANKLPPSVLAVLAQPAPEELPPGHTHTNEHEHDHTH